MPRGYETQAICNIKFTPKTRPNVAKKRVFGAKKREKSAIFNPIDPLPG